MIQRLSVGVLLALAVLIGGLPDAAQAQVTPGPWFTIAPDGRVSTWDMTCRGDAYMYMHVLIYTSAGRKVISFTNACYSSVGVPSKLVYPPGTPGSFPTLLDSDGVIKRIDVIGWQRRYSDNSAAHTWPLLRSTSGDTLDEKIHAGNLVEQYDDSLEPASSVSLYLYASPPVP